MCVLVGGLAGAAVAGKVAAAVLAPPAGGFDVVELALAGVGGGVGGGMGGGVAWAVERLRR